MADEPGKDPIWKPVSQDQLSERRKTDRMHVGLASGLLVVAVGTGASSDAIGLGPSVALVASISLAFSSLVAGIIHLLLLEKYLGHLAQSMAYNAATATTREGRLTLLKASQKERERMPKDRDLMGWRWAKFLLGLVGLMCYAVFGVWTALI